MIGCDRESANRRITERLRKAGVPVTLIDRDIGAFPSRSELDLVGVDNFAGGYLLAEHLIKLGMRRLAYVVRPLTASTVDARIAGARIAMLDHGLENPRQFVFAGDPSDLKFWWLGKAVAPTCNVRLDMPAGSPAISAFCGLASPRPISHDADTQR